MNKEIKNKEIEVGVSYTSSLVVGMENTAIHLKSGTHTVFATPAMVALMENAAMNAVLPYLPEGQTTVGVKLNIKHVKATPIGMKVSSEAILKEIDGKKLVFSVKAWDEEGEIGSGEHTRFLVGTIGFMDKLLITKSK
jgi:predicted thioesterase